MYPYSFIKEQIKIRDLIVIYFTLLSDSTESKVK